MIYQLIDLPPNVIGFRASWQVTREDFDEVVIPCVQKHVEKMGHINYVLVLNSSIKSSSFCAWLKDVLLSLKNITKWNRAAIVTDSKAVKIFTQIFGLLVPGEFRAFTHRQAQQAISWVAGSDKK